MINYDGKTFRSVENSSNGEVSGDTTFHYRQDGNIVWAEYAGGDIVRGTLIATADKNGVLDMRYLHVNKSGALMTGECISKPNVLSDGRIRLHEKWRWTCGDHSTGESTVEEIFESTF